MELLFHFTSLWASPRCTRAGSWSSRSPSRRLRRDPPPPAPPSPPPPPSPGAPLSMSQRRQGGAAGAGAGNFSSSGFPSSKSRSWRSDVPRRPQVPRLPTSSPEDPSAGRDQIEPAHRLVKPAKGGVTQQQPSATGGVKTDPALSPDALDLGAALVAADLSDLGSRIRDLRKRNRRPAGVAATRRYAGRSHRVGQANPTIQRPTSPRTGHGDVSRVDRAASRWRPSNQAVCLARISRSSSLQVRVAMRNCLKSASRTVSTMLIRLSSLLAARSMATCWPG